MIANHVLAGFGRAGQNAENVDALAELRGSGNCRCDTEEICQAYQLGSTFVLGESCRPADEERYARTSVKETLLLPGMVISKVVAMIREEANDVVVRIVTCFHGIKNPSETIVDV